MKLIGDRLDPTQLSSLGAYELGVWATPAGTTFVDGGQYHTECLLRLTFSVTVLASKKGVTTGVEKGKDADINKWEAELRKSLAHKKPAQPTLTKQEKALVDAQLTKEEATRNQLRILQQRLQDGLSMIHSLLASQTVGYFSHLPSLASLLMEGILKYGTPFIGSDGISTYFVSTAGYFLHLSYIYMLQTVFMAASERLETQRLWTAVAILRSYEVENVPEQYTAEPLDSEKSRLSPML